MLFRFFDSLFELKSKQSWFILIGPYIPLLLLNFLIIYLLKKPTHFPCNLLESAIADCVPMILSNVLPYSFFFLPISSYWRLPVSWQAATCPEGESAS